MFVGAVYYPITKNQVKSQFNFPKQATFQKSCFFCVDNSMTHGAFARHSFLHFSLAIHGSPASCGRELRFYGRDLCAFIFKRHGGLHQDRRAKRLRKEQGLCTAGVLSRRYLLLPLSGAGTSGDTCRSCSGGDIFGLAEQYSEFLSATSIARYLEATRNDCLSLF